MFNCMWYKCSNCRKSCFNQGFKGTVTIWACFSLTLFWRTSSLSKIDWGGGGHILIFWNKSITFHTYLQSPRTLIKKIAYIYWLELFSITCDKAKSEQNAPKYTFLKGSFKSVRFCAKFSKPKCVFKETGNV